MFKLPFEAANKIIHDLATEDGVVVNPLLDGLPTETPLALTGMPESGKSILAMEIAFNAVKQLGGNILIINTEKPRTQLYDGWETVFKRKYGLPDVKVFLEETFSVEALMALNGYDMVIQSSTPKLNKKTGEYTKPKKMPVLKEVNVDDAPVRKYIKEEGVRAVIYDSLTTPFNAVLMGGQQNTPERFNVTEMFFQSTRLLFHGSDAAIITNNHVTYNPMSMFLTREAFEAKGGKSILHNQDYIFYLEQAKGKYAISQRGLWIQRHPRMKGWRELTTMWLDDDGFREVSKADAETLKNALKPKGKDVKDGEDAE